MEMADQRHSKFEGVEKPPRCRGIFKVRRYGKLFVDFLTDSVGYH